MQTDMKPPAQAALALARTLRGRGLVAAGSAGIDGAARVLVFSRSTARLAGQVYVVTRDGTLWFCWPGQPPCSAGDTATIADTITRALAARTDPAASPTTELAQGGAR